MKKKDYIKKYGYWAAVIERDDRNTEMEEKYLVSFLYSMISIAIIGFFVAMYFVWI